MNAFDRQSYKTFWCIKVLKHIYYYDYTIIVK